VFEQEQAGGAVVDRDHTCVLDRAVDAHHRHRQLERLLQTAARQPRAAEHERAGVIGQLLHQPQLLGRILAALTN
jgi:hypothetical protein